MKTFLKIILFSVLLCLAGAATFWVVWRNQWPWWVGVAIMSGIIGLVVGGMFLKHYLLRRREKKFVRRVVELDDAAIRSAPLHERRQLLDLQESWKESVELLSNSYLRKRGNPLYVLPWFMVLGESGVGKSSALHKASLSSPLTEVKRIETISATRNCDWWFFEQAIVLDTAGRYTIPVDEAADREEWEKFLVLLSKYRRKEPLNGVVVVIPADQLLECNEIKIREDGQNIRTRIDHLMRIVGASFPVYVLVSKMDYVHGFTGFSDGLDDLQIQQAMGFVNKNSTPYWSEVLSSGMQALSKSLRDMRLLLAYNIDNVKPAALLFPNEFEKLNCGLAVLVKAVFEENPYQETPLFRGFYFSSSRQDSRPQSEFLDFVGLTPPKDEKSTALQQGRGIFLKALFADILPGDRNLFKPIREFLRWKMITRSTALVSWLLIWVFLCGLLSFSFYFNLKTIRDFKKVFYNSPELIHDDVADVFMLDRMRIEIIDLEEDNAQWLPPRLWLYQSREMEEKTKQKFVMLFKQGILRPLEMKLSKNIDQVGADTSQDAVATYISYTVAEINLISSYLQTGKMPDFDHFQKINNDIMKIVYPHMPVEISEKIGLFYYDYIDWEKDEVSLRSRLERLQISLEHLTRKSGDMKWLVRMLIPDADPVRLRNFWGETSSGYSEDLIISGAYTALGREHIDKFIADLEESLVDRTVISKRKPEFWKWYRQRFYESWYDFANRFNEGQEGLQSAHKWQNMAALMTTEQNPYFRFLERMADEMTKYAHDQTTPPWVSMVVEISQVRKMAAAMDEKEQPTLLGKIKKEEQKVAQKIDKYDPRSAKSYENRLAGAKIWKEYEKALAPIASVSSSKEISYRLLGEYFMFSEKATDSLPAFFSARTSFLKLQSFFTAKEEAPFILDLVSGPLDFLLDYSASETACQLQSLWEEQVSAPVQKAGKEKRAQMLFDKPDGLVWKFIDDPARPFVKMGKNGYVARKAFDREIPFFTTFLDFLNGGAKRLINYQPQYYVELETVPIDVNDGASAAPYANVLSLQCAGEKLTLKNYNYPAKMNFKWSPDQCGDVTLQLILPNLVLTKEYKGSLGFANFLQEFRQGTRTFTAVDFPDDVAELKQLNINWISVSYKITDAAPILQFLQGGLTMTPVQIVPCWTKAYSTQELE